MFIIDLGENVMVSILCCAVAYVCKIEKTKKEKCHRTKNGELKKKHIRHIQCWKSTNPIEFKFDLCLLYGGQMHWGKQTQTAPQPYLLLVAIVKSFNVYVSCGTNTPLTKVSWCGQDRYMALCMVLFAFAWLMNGTHADGDTIKMFCRTLFAQNAVSSQSMWWKCVSSERASERAKYLKRQIAKWVAIMMEMDWPVSLELPITNHYHSHQLVWFHRKAKRRALAMNNSPP